MSISLQTDKSSNCYGIVAKLAATPALDDRLDKYNDLRSSEHALRVVCYSADDRRVTESFDIPRLSKDNKSARENALQSILKNHGRVEIFVKENANEQLISLEKLLYTATLSDYAHLTDQFEPERTNGW